MTKKILLLLAVVLLIVGAVIGMLSKDVETKPVTGLPWQIDASDEQLTRVFLVGVGHDSLSELVHSLKKVPELAIFTDKDESKILEAYFSRTKVGLLQARLTAEVDISDVDLDGFARLDGSGKAMPSGKRKYGLSKTGIVAANGLRVWKLVYLPTTNYSPEQIVQFFGEPEEKQVVTETVENWMYPAKGLIVTHDKEGSEVFYYSARLEYQRLLNSVPQKGPADGG